MHRVVGCCVETNNTAAKGGGEKLMSIHALDPGENNKLIMFVCVCEFTQISPTV